MISPAFFYFGEENRSSEGDLTRSTPQMADIVRQNALFYLLCPRTDIPGIGEFGCNFLESIKSTGVAAVMPIFAVSAKELIGYWNSRYTYLPALSEVRLEEFTSLPDNKYDLKISITTADGFTYLLRHELTV